MEDASPKVLVKGSFECASDFAVVAEKVVLFVLNGNLVSATVGFMADNYICFYDPLSSFPEQLLLIFTKMCFAY